MKDLLRTADLTSADFARLLDMVKAFGFTCFEYWLPPTLNDPAALEYVTTTGDAADENVSVVSVP